MTNVDMRRCNKAKPVVYTGIVAVCVIVSVATFTGCIGEETATTGVSATPTPTAFLKTDPDNATIDKTPWMKIIFQDIFF